VQDLERGWPQCSAGTKKVVSKTSVEINRVWVFHWGRRRQVGLCKNGNVRGLVPGKKSEYGQLSSVGERKNESHIIVKWQVSTQGGAGARWVDSGVNGTNSGNP